MKLADRLEAVKRFQLCYNCLNPHLISRCVSNSVCHVCKKNSHHTLLQKYTTGMINPVPDVQSPDTEQNFHSLPLSIPQPLGTASIVYEWKAEKRFDKYRNNLCEKLIRQIYRVKGNSWFSKWTQRYYFRSSWIIRI